ncbi:MAG TPA: lytic transglycosylase domain-containing protein [Longimicrobiales bacterium]|nr:lytic transglycosylase domain-containing protein [Longimicrobiales bacterium]
MSEPRPERRVGDMQRHITPPPTDVPMRRNTQDANRPGKGRVAAWWRESRSIVVSVALASVMFLLAAAAALGPQPGAAIDSLEAELRRTQSELSARQGELELARLELGRLSNIVSQSAAHRIPADLAAAVYDIALSEGVDPVLAFSLIRVESGFTRRAVSSAGAVGYTQVMPSTAFWLQPGLGREDLFERDTNLRLGFRYLRMMIEQYDGDLHLALLAYNRGPGRVDEILRAGGDPSNGYSFNVRSGLPGSTLKALRLRGD